MRLLAILALCPLLALGACTNSGTASTTTHGAQAHPGGGGPPGTGGGGADSAPARDSFTGTILSGTGAYSHAHGRVIVHLHPRGSGTARPIRVVVIGRCGGGSHHCTALNGAVSGRLTPAGPRLPDVGHGFKLSGAGRVTPLGHVTLRGAVSGTGFIAHGHEQLTITLSSSSGSMTVQAVSGPVKGFSSP